MDAFTVRAVNAAVTSQRSSSSTPPGQSWMQDMAPYYASLSQGTSSEASAYSILLYDIHDNDKTSIDTTVSRSPMSKTPFSSTSSTPSSSLQSLPGYHRALSVQYPVSLSGGTSNCNYTGSATPSTSYPYSESNVNDCWLDTTGNCKDNLISTYAHSSNQVANRQSLNMGINAGQQVYEVSRTHLFSSLVVTCFRRGIQE